MKKFLSFILMIAILLTGCSQNSEQVEDLENNATVKAKYEEYLTEYWEDAFYEGNDTEYGVDEFALIDINNDGIQELLIKNNKLNIFSVLTISNNSIETIKFERLDLFTNQYGKSSFEFPYLQSRFNEIDTIINSKKDITFGFGSGNKAKRIFEDFFPLYENTGLYLINGQFLSIPIVLDDYWYGFYYFTYFTKAPLVSEESEKLSYDVEKSLIDEYDQLSKEIGYYFTNVIIMETYINGNMIYMDNTLTKGVTIFAEDGSFSLSEEGYGYNIGNDYKKMYYNANTGTKGKNIETMEEIKFHELNNDNMVKYFQ